MDEKLLFKLINAFGPSGLEINVRKIIEKEMKKYVDEIKTDKFGNLICHKQGKGKKLMLAAHMDEVGLIIREIKKDGKLKFSVVGGVETLTLIGEVVALVNDKEVICEGVITYKELQDDLEKDELPTTDELHIDTGLTKKELEKKKITIGTYAIPYNHARTLGNKKIIAGKALDDRLGCFILIELAKKLKKTKKEIYYVFTVQEEVGLIGAKTAVYKIDPEWGIAVDVTNTEDYEKEGIIKLGKGPTLSIMDEEMISNKCIDEHIKKIAKQKKIPLQLKVDNIGTTDATKIMLSKGGVPSTVIGVAIRNMHSTISIGHKHDIKQAINLLYHIIKNQPKKCFN